MDKNTYETYEYLSVDNSNTESEFFVVQEDGTFLINRQVQYIATQVQDKEEVMEGVQVYDVASQPFFVDVENSAQLNLVPDNLILPEGASNLYGNNFLLQTVPRPSTDQMEEDVKQFEETDSQEKLKETENQEIDADVDNNDNKQSSICTEITLSDEQYNMLEQKGWVLLETSDKVFLLDTLGLHDITNNQELIEQLQAENRSCEDLENDARSDKIPRTSPPIVKNSTAASSEQDTVEYVIDDDCSSQNEEDIPETTVVADSEEAKNNITQITESKKTVEKKEMPTKMELVEKVKAEPQISKDKKSIVRIKTKLLLKDLPDKIVLGNTVNGKKLVAKLVKPIKTEVKKCTIIDRKPKQLVSEVAAEDPSSKSLTESLEWQFEKMVRESLYNARSGTESGLEHVAEAREVVTQLLKVPAFQLAVIERNLVISKSLRKKAGNDQTESMLSSLVTGRVTSVEGENRFVYIPDMLQKLMSEMESNHATGSLLKQNPVNKPKDYSVLHVHVTETKCGNTNEGVSITLNKRHLEPFSDVKRQYDKMYACSACANIFESEAELMDHQENQCMDSEDALTIDTEDINKVLDENIKLNPYYILKTDTGTHYACLQCSLKFNKLSNCQRHIKTHVNPVKAVAPTDDENEKQKSVSEQIFQCKMCSSSYFHPSTLSKHIVAAHINTKVNSN